MKKKVSLFLVVCMTVLLAACGKGNSRTFTVGFDAEFPPYGYLDNNGNYVGFDLDLVAENIALRDSFGILTEYADYNTAFMDLEAGALDAVAMDIGVAEYQIESRNGGYVILEQRLATEQYGVGFLLGNKELRDTVKATLKDMAEDGTFAKIAEEWGLADSPECCFLTSLPPHWIPS